MSRMLCCSSVSVKSTMSSSFLGEQFGEDGGVAVRRVPRCEDQRERAGAGELTKRRELVTVDAELTSVAARELVEAIRHVPVPAAQLVAGGQLARPSVQRGTVARDAAWPDVVNQEPIAVIRRCRLVGALDPDGHD